MISGSNSLCKKGIQGVNNLGNSRSRKLRFVHNNKNGSVF